VVDLGDVEVALDELAQEEVAGDDVDARLRVDVEPGAELGGDLGVEVRHLDLDVDARLVPVGVVEAADVDLQVAVAPRPLAATSRPFSMRQRTMPRPALISYSGFCIVSRRIRGCNA
jgi:hypothetical protein